MRVCGTERLFLCEGPLGEKAFVGKDSCSRGMIDGDQPSLVYKVDLLHRLAEAKTEESVTRMQLIAVHLDPFVGVRNICARRRHPVANHRCADHVGDEVVAGSVPGKERWA